MNTWTLKSWQTKTLYQDPHYYCDDSLEVVMNRLKELPPLVTVEEIIKLQNLLKEVANGKGFILQIGDCAESFNHSRFDVISKKVDFYNRLAGILEQDIKLPIIKIGRIAGQYAKPRTNNVEFCKGNNIPVYRGDMINSAVPELKQRTSNPDLMLHGYHSSKEALKHISWLCNNKRTTNDQLFVSHESLLLQYEQSLTRYSKKYGGWYNHSTHYPWLGMRTALPDSAHVEYLRGINNPIAIKVGPDITINCLLSIISRINPENIKGRITLIPRLGAENIKRYLPNIIRGVNSAKLNVIWLCDPMHGNTELTDCNLKTRRMENILKEIDMSFKIHNEMGTILGGIHLEATFEDVTECLNQGEHFDRDNLNYTSLLDPRLNKSQSINVIKFISEKISKYWFLDERANRYVV